MNESKNTPALNLRQNRNVAAVVLSIIPGLGHIYKGHYLAGFVILLLGVPVVLWVGTLLTLATAGVGLLFPVCCWAMAATDAYFEKDLRKHHALEVF